jgi:hypothetical protein
MMVRLRFVRLPVVLLGLFVVGAMLLTLPGCGGRFGGSGSGNPTGGTNDPTRDPTRQPR